jgi:hypothetical protein
MLIRIPIFGVSGGGGSECCCSPVSIGIVGSRNIPIKIPAKKSTGSVMSNAASPCCVCIGGVNYTVSCAENKCGGSGCGGNAQAMSTVKPNASAGQSVSGGCGGASCVSNALNAIGKWGTAITGIATGKAVNAGGVAVGAAGSQSVSGFNGTTLVIILVVVVVVIMLMREG